MADTREAAPAYRGDHQAKPLPFDPTRLRGLSERLLRSHHENNYTGAVKRLNLIQQQLGQVPKDAPPYQTGSLKREELIATNSMLLHEFYFENLGGETYWLWDHTHSLAWGTPLLVLDMYEHSYAMDYGANARGYLDAFFQNIQWDEVNRRAEQARGR